MSWMKRLFGRSSEVLQKALPKPEVYKMSESPYISCEHRRVHKLIEDAEAAGKTPPVLKEGEHGCPECFGWGVMRTIGGIEAPGHRYYVQCDFCGWNETLDWVVGLPTFIGTTTHVEGNILDHLAPVPGSFTAVRKDLMENPDEEMGKL